MRLEPLLTIEHTVILSGLSDRDEVLRELAARAHESLPEIPADALHKELVDRERRHPTSTPEAVAFPHAMVPGIDRTRLVVALLRPGVPFGVSSHPPCDLVFAMFGNQARPFEHVQLLARLARICRGDTTLDRLRGAKDAQHLLDLLIAEDQAHG